MFIAMEDTTELNPFSKHGIFLLLHTSWRGRALHMSSLFGSEERESRAASRKTQPARTLAQQIQESRQQFNGFRKTLAAAHRDAMDERAALFLEHG
jgi:hypothetical protein